MTVFYMVVSASGNQAPVGKFSTYSEAEEFAKLSCIKHIKNDAYVILESVGYIKAKVSISSKKLNK